MSHIRVDDEMHRRIMNAVSEAIEQGAEAKSDDILNTHFKTSYAKAEISQLNSVEEEDRVKTPIKRKAKVSVIKILSIAAAAILVAGGALMFATKFMGMTKSAMPMNEVAQATTAMEVDSALILDGERNSLNKNATFSANTNRPKSTKGTALGVNSAGDKKAEEGLKEETTEGNDEGDGKTYAPGAIPSEAPTEAADSEKKDIKDSLPFKVKTVGTGSLKGNIAMTVYTGENGEKMILFTAKAGTDIAKAYYPDFKGKPALLQTEAGQVFKAIDTSVAKNAQVSNNGPFNAVTWTKDGTDYMLMFSTKTDVQVFISLMEMI